MLAQLRTVAAMGAAGEAWRAGAPATGRGFMLGALGTGLAALAVTALDVGGAATGQVTLGPVSYVVGGRFVLISW